MTVTSIDEIKRNNKSNRNIEEISEKLPEIFLILIFDNIFMILL